MSSGQVYAKGVYSVERAVSVEIPEDPHVSKSEKQKIGHLLCTVLVRLSFADNDLSAYQDPSIRECVVAIISRCGQHH